MMTKVKANMGKEKRLTDVIQRQIGTADNRRFLARMPAFRPDAKLPDNFQALLGELDRAEAAAGRSR